MRETINDELKIKDIDTIEKINGESLDIVKENVKKLKEIFPEVFCEDKIDFKRLEEVLGEYTDDSDERYRFEWHGKSQAIKFSQTPSKGTLRPCKEESKNWDTTENLYIEGDNLEVLKLLQKSYQGKIKMIYIDPPYNTGNDFIYPDNYRDNMENYFKITGQKDEEGNRITTNSEDGGRYHTNWLNMMYPRLRLAKNLLTEDGTIFISIDDNEIDNLKKMCDEIFGENNFITNICHKNRDGVSNDKLISSNHNIILFYAKNYQCIHKKRHEFGIKRSEEDFKNYTRDDSDGNGVYTLNPVTGPGGALKGNPYYEILGIKNYWRFSKERMTKMINDGLIVRINNNLYQKTYKKDMINKKKGATTWWDSVGTTAQGTKELKQMFSKSVFNYAKPIEMIEHIINYCEEDKSEIILDFFSGSSTTAHAVMKVNSEDNGKRKFIMVQLPEQCNEKTEAYKAGYKNICEIGKERIRRAGDKIVEENKDKEGIEDLDVGFKVFKLDTSNIKPWNPDYDNLEMTLEDSVDNFVPGRTEEDILYEIMLKYGIDLTYPVDVKEICGKKLFNVGFGALIVCLDSDITLELVNEIIKYKNELNPKTCRVVFRDNGFKTDSVKTNAIEILHRNNIKEIMSI